MSNNNPYNVSLNNKTIRERRPKPPFYGEGPRPNFTNLPGSPKEVKHVSVSRPDLAHKQATSYLNGTASEVGSNYVSNIYNNYLLGKLNAVAAGNCITGKIRALFVNGLDKGTDTFDIESLKYLDQILFNDLSYLISCALMYGSAGGLIDIIKEKISDSCKTIDYTLNDQKAIDEIDEIIKYVELYTNRFA